MINLVIGAVLLIGGIAASSSGSKIFIGAMIVGVIQIVRGLISLAG